MLACGTRRLETHGVQDAKIIAGPGVVQGGKKRSVAKRSEA